MTYSYQSEKIVQDRRKPLYEKGDKKTAVQKKGLVKILQRQFNRFFWINF